MREAMNGFGERAVVVAAGVLAFGALAPLPARAADVEFMTWTYTEETGKAIVETMVEDFEAETALTVEPQGYAWGEMSKNLFLRARSNTLPDVTQVQGRLLPTFAGLDAAIDLNEVIERDELEAMFAPGFLAMGEVDGRQIALPWIGGTIGMVANAEVLEQAGVETIPTTVEAFRAALEKVRDEVPSSVPYGLATKNENSIVLDYLVWVWTFGGEVIDADGQPQVDSPEAVAALEFMASLVKERLAAPEIDRPDARRLFGQGAMAFYFDAPVARTFARQFSGRGEEIDAAVKPVPTPVLGDGDTPVSIQWGHVIMPLGEDNASADAAAIKWMMHLLSDAALVDYAVDQSALPVTASGIAAERVQNDAYLSDWAAASIEPRRNAIASLDNGPAVSAIIGEEMQAAILGQKTPAEAASSMQSRLEDAL